MCTLDTAVISDELYTAERPLISGVLTASCGPIIRDPNSINRRLEKQDLSEDLEVNCVDQPNDDETEDRRCKTQNRANAR